MNRSRPSATWIAAFLGAACAINALGGPVTYPEKDAVVTFTVPDGWKTSVLKDGSFTATPNGPEEFAVGFYNAPFITGDEHASLTLPEFAKGMGEAAGMKNPVPGPVKEIKLGSKEALKVIACEVLGPSTTLGDKASVTTYIVKSAAGKYIAIAVIADAKSQGKYDIPTLVMLNSLATAR